MSGHSKWATTKHQKAAKDAKRSKVFAKLIKNIEVAARHGRWLTRPATRRSTTPSRRPRRRRSRTTTSTARSSAVPAPRRAASDWQTIMYEGYGPDGVALLIECLTDNRNRAATEVRTALTRNGGSLADPGSVAYLFSRKGVVLPSSPGRPAHEDDILDAVLDAGAEEVNDNGDTWEVVSEPTDLVAVRTALQDAGIDYESAEASVRAEPQIELDVDGAKKVLHVIDALEDSDDVQNVYANGDIPDDVLAQLDDDEE